MRGSGKVNAMTEKKREILKTRCGEAVLTCQRGGIDSTLPLRYNIK